MQEIANRSYLSEMSKVNIGLQQPGYLESRAGTGNGVFRIMALFFAFEFVRPQDMFGFLAPLHIPMFLNLLMIIIWLTKGQWRGLNERLVQYFFLFILSCAVTITFAQISESVYMKVRILLILMVTGVLPMVAFLSQPKPLMKFFRVWAILHMVLAVIVILKGGVGSGSFLEDENDAALALLMGLPFVTCLAISPRLTSLRQRLFYQGGMILILAAVVTTGSRGGFVGLVAVLFVLWVRSRHRVKKLVIGATAVLLLAGPLAYMLPEGYVGEITSITDTTEDTAYERIRSWRVGLIMFQHNPVFGIGAGNYLWEAGRYSKMDTAEIQEGQRETLYARTAHSAFVTVLSETGSVGSLFYLLIIVGCVKSIRKSKINLQLVENGKAEEVTELLLLGRALEASLAGFLTAGALLSVAYYPNLWWLLGMIVALQRISSAMLSEKSPRRRQT